MPHDTTYTDAKAGLVIDKDELDNELIRQPPSYQDAAEQSALAQSRADEAKDELKTMEAQLYLRFRTEGMEGEGKVTEKMLEHMVQQSPERLKAHRAYIEAVAEASRWDDLKEAFRQRGNMLRELTNLYVAGYFSAASVRGGVGKVQDHAHEERRARIVADKKQRKQGGRTRLEE